MRASMYSASVRRRSLLRNIRVKPEKNKSHKLHGLLALFTSDIKLSNVELDSQICPSCQKQPVACHMPTQQVGRQLVNALARHSILFHCSPNTAWMEVSSCEAKQH